MLVRPQPKLLAARTRSIFPCLAAGAATLALIGPAQAQTGTFAPGLTESSADSGLTTPFNTDARTYMGFLSASDFAAFTTPVYITGIQFRLATGYNSQITTTTWPSTDLTFSDYSLQLAQASAADVAAGDLEDGTSFANNQAAGTAVDVLSGPLTIAAGSFSNSLTGTNAFGPTLAFSTPYLFTPGTSLTYLIDESGYGASSTATQAAFASSDYTPGVADALVSTVGAGQAAPEGYTSPLIVQFEYSTDAPTAPVPEASTSTSFGLMLAFGLGLVAVKRRSNREQAAQK